LAEVSFYFAPGNLKTDRITVDIHDYDIALAEMRLACVQNLHMPLKIEKNEGYYNKSVVMKRNK